MENIYGEYYTSTICYNTDCIYVSINTLDIEKINYEYGNRC